MDSSEEYEDVFFGPVTERELRARALFEKRIGRRKDTNLSILDTMNDYLLNDSHSRKSMSLLGDISESPDKPFKKMNDIPESLEVSSDSIQEELCNDFKELDINRPNFQNHPDYSYIMIDNNYSLISEPEVKSSNIPDSNYSSNSEPEPRLNANIQPDLEGLSILSEAAIIHSSKFSEEKYSIDSLEKSKEQLNFNSNVENVIDPYSSIKKEDLVNGPSFNDTVEAIEALLSKQNDEESTYPDTTSNLPIDQTNTLKQPISHYIKSEEHISNSWDYNLNNQTPKFEIKKKISNSPEIKYNDTLDALDEILAKPNKEQTTVYPDSTTMSLNPEQNSLELKYNQNYDSNEEFLNSEIKREQILYRDLNNRSDSKEKPASSIPIAFNKKTSNNKQLIPKNNFLEVPKVQPSYLKTTTIKNKPTGSCFKTPIQSSKLKKKQKYDHIISPVAAYIHKASPKLIQNVKCEKSFNENKLTPSQKENVDTNNASMEFPRVNYKKGVTLALQEKLKPTFPNNLSPQIQKLLPESTQQLCNHIGHLRIDGDSSQNQEYSLIIRKKC